jgi:hypothetical protein
MMKAVAFIVRSLGAGKPLGVTVPVTPAVDGAAARKSHEISDPAGEIPSIEGVYGAICR